MISLVIPIYNEEENLAAVRKRVTESLDRCDEAWEVIFANDGSRDRSAEIIRQYCTEDPRFRAVFLSRNFGHQPAVSAGVDHARGDCVVLMDGDLQDPPEVIPDMVKAWRGGMQVVVGERRSRQEGGLRGIGFKLFYPIFRSLTELQHAPDAGIFGLLDRKVVDELVKLPERNRFIPGLRVWLGFKQGSVIYDREERAAGAPKQTFRRLVKYAFDGMISFSYKPLRAMIWLGGLVSMGAFFLAVFYLVTFFALHKTTGSGFTTTIICVLFLGGVQLISVGVLGEYIGRIYEEVKQRPLYVVGERVNVAEAKSATAAN